MSEHLHDDRHTSPASGGNGAAGAPSRETELHRKAAMLVNADTGVRFDSLTLFAEPLFELFDPDVSHAFSLQTEPESADEGTIAALEAARLFWAYFSLPIEERTDASTALARNLLGPSASPEEEADFDLLLDRMSEQWDMQADEDIELAESTPARTLDFDELLQHPLYAVEAGQVGDTYGPGHLPETEARALFAQPLLNQAEDLDDMEDAIERATAYWELAQLPFDVREDRLEALLVTLASASVERGQLRDEAHTMIARFEDLFPEHSG